MAITKLIRTALDRAVHKELIDTKFVYFFEGLAVVLWSSIKVCTNNYMYRLRELCKVRYFSAENPSLLATCGSYRYKKGTWITWKERHLQEINLQALNIHFKHDRDFIVLVIMTLDEAVDLAI